MIFIFQHPVFPKADKWDITCTFWMTNELTAGPTAQAFHRPRESFSAVSLSYGLANGLASFLYCSVVRSSGCSSYPCNYNMHLDGCAPRGSFMPATASLKLSLLNSLPQALSYQLFNHTPVSSMSRMNTPCLWHDDHRDERLGVLLLNSCRNDDVRSYLRGMPWQSL